LRIYSLFCIDIKEDYFIHGSSQVLKSGEASTQKGAMTQYIKQLIMYFILCWSWSRQFQNTGRLVK